MTPLDQFLIGVWAQPDFEYVGPQKNVKDDRVKKWVDRGVTQFFNGEHPEPNTPSNTRAVFANWVRDHGAVPWMYASSDPVADAALGLGGFLQPDEPDLWNHLRKKPDGAYDMDATIAAYVENYQKIKAACPLLNVLGNFDGSQLTAVGSGNTPINLDHYRRWLEGCDLPSFDWYLTNTNRSVEKYLSVIGKGVGRLRGLAPGKPPLVCIECSNQNLDQHSRAPTPDEFAAMVHMAVIAGAQGVWYFPQRMVGMAADATPPDVAERMTEINANLAQLGQFFIKGTQTKVPDFTGTCHVGEWELAGRKLTLTLNALASPQTIGLRLYKPFEATFVESAASAPLPAEATTPGIDARLDAITADLKATRQELADLKTSLSREIIIRVL